MNIAPSSLFDRQDISTPRQPRAIARPAAHIPVADGPPTLWGLEISQLHDRYWAAHGTQIVRVGERSELVPLAEFFLLTDPRSLVLFPLHLPVDDFNWLHPHVLYLRIRDRRDRTYREFVRTDDDGRFVGFRRAYDGDDPRLGRVVLTTDPDIARVWQNATDVSSASRTLRRAIRPMDRAVRSVDGHIFDRSTPADASAFLRHLQVTWRNPDATIPRAVRSVEGVCTDGPTSASLLPRPQSPPARIVPPVWVGAGRALPAAGAVIGPAVLFDDPAHRPAPPALDWHDLITVRGQFPEPAVKPRSRPLFNFAKRVFDITFATIALTFTAPLYPLILAAIYLEDGRPFYFSHTRETVGGRPFGCLKFRSMRKNAEQLKRELAQKNQADGPQFFIEKDPRLTRVGAFLRRYNLDELPQFINVLRGDMSVVGPRPSPHSENQFCPPWREARLSVRPGITGLWQVSRTRRAGCDFQEWIKYDLEYVEKASFFYDLNLIGRTIAMLFRKAGQS